MYQLTLEEWTSLTFQYGMSKKQGRGGRRTLPYGFTQEGVAMLSSVLNSERAREVNIAILRTFAKLRKTSDTTTELTEKIDTLKVDLNRQLEALSSNVQQVMNAVEAISLQNVTVPKSSQILPILSSLTESTVGSQNTFVRKRTLSEVEAIQNAVAHYYQISVDDLGSANRTESITLPRQICMYLIRNYTRFSYKRIGTILGGRDHATVLYGCRRIESKLTAKAEVSEALEAIQSCLKPGGMTLKHNQ
jgi:chromosomal replication initiation ATPase DnaA